jgi:hypothetical protein
LGGYKCVRRPHAADAQEVREIARRILAEDADVFQRLRDDDGGDDDDGVAWVTGFGPVPASATSPTPTRTRRDHTHESSERVHGKDADLIQRLAD